MFSLNTSSFRQDVWYLGITKLYQNTLSIYKILQYSCFNWTYCVCSYAKWVWDLSHYTTFCMIFNSKVCKISDIGCVPPFWTVMVSWYPLCIYATISSELCVMKCASLNGDCILTIFHNHILYLYLHNKAILKHTAKCQQ